jgi:hypothetical protein
LTACGANLQINTKINPDFSGERTFIIEVSKSDLNTIELSPEKLKEIIYQNLPMKMDLYIKEDDQKVIYTLQHSFKNIKQLVDDSEKILGYKPTIKISYKGKMLKYTYTYQDKTPPEDYFKWLSGALIKNNIGTKYKDNFVNSITYNVSLPLTDYKNATSFTTDINFPTNQGAWIIWDPSSRTGKLNVEINIAPVTYEALQAMKIDFKKSLEESFNRKVGEIERPDGGRQYTTTIPIKGSLSELTKTPVFSNGTITETALPKTNLIKASEINIHANPTEYLLTSDIDSITFIYFSDNTKITNTKFSTDLNIPNSRFRQIDKNHIDIHLGDQTPMNVTIDIEYSHTYLMWWLLAGVTLIGLIIWFPHWRKKHVEKSS